MPSQDDRPRVDGPFGQDWGSTGGKLGPAFMDAEQLVTLANAGQDQRHSVPRCSLADPLPVLRGRRLAESHADGRQRGFGVAAVNSRSVAVAVDIPWLVVPSTDLVPQAPRGRLPRRLK